MIAKISKETNHYVHCPSCGEADSTIDHLEDNFKSKWYCDNCGVRYDITKNNGGGEVTETNEQLLKTLIFLRHHNVGLVVEGIRFEPVGHRIGTQTEADRYHYDEHTCPTNYMGRVLAVINLNNWDCDPHGIFEFCGSQDMPNGFDKDGEYSVFAERFVVKEI